MLRDMWEGSVEGLMGFVVDFHFLVCYTPRIGESLWIHCYLNTTGILDAPLENPARSCPG